MNWWRTMATTSTDYTRTIRNPSLKYSSPEVWKAGTTNTISLPCTWVPTVAVAHTRKHIRPNGYSIHWRKTSPKMGNTATDCMRLSFSTIPNPVRSITKTAKDSVITTKKTISTGANMWLTTSHWVITGIIPVSTSPSSAMRTSCCSMPSVWTMKETLKKPSNTSTKYVTVYT